MHEIGSELLAVGQSAKFDARSDASVCVVALVWEGSLCLRLVVETTEDVEVRVQQVEGHRFH